MHVSYVPERRDGYCLDLWAVLGCPLSHTGLGSTAKKKRYTTYKTLGGASLITQLWCSHARRGLWRLSAAVPARVPGRWWACSRPCRIRTGSWDSPQRSREKTWRDEAAVAAGTAVAAVTASRSEGTQRTAPDCRCWRDRGRRRWRRNWEKRCLGHCRSCNRRKRRLGQSRFSSWTVPGPQCRREGTSVGLEDCRTAKERLPRLSHLGCSCCS